MKTAGSRREKGALVHCFCILSTFQLAMATITLAAAPPNDQFANRIVLSGPNAQITGSSVSATVQAGEPVHGDFPGGMSVWWSWTAPASGTCTVSTEGSSFYTLLAVYSGNTLTNLARLTAAPAFSGANGTSLTRFYAVRGVTYAIAVDGYYGASGQVALALELAMPTAVNSWTKNTSGNWEESFWSMSTRPGANQSLVSVTNAGTKSITIAPQTVSQAAGSLLISNLSLSAPVGTLNTLFLNNSGSSNPLRIQENLIVQTNAKVTLVSAGLRVGEHASGSLFLGGAFSQAGSSESFFQSAQIGYGQAGQFDLSNGVVTAGELTIGGASAGTLNHLGGTARVQGLLSIRNAGGIYSLQGGILHAATVQVGQGSGGGSARFRQSSGSATISNEITIGDASYLNGGRGTFELHGGSVSSPVLAGKRGTINQTAGTNSTVTAQLGGSDVFIYNISGGLWSSSDDYLGYYGDAVVNQTGGSHVVTNALYVFAYGGYSGQGTYNLTNGSLTASAFYLGARGTLNQAGGALSLHSSLGIGNGGMVRLMGGTITTPRTTIGDWALEDFPTFTQSGGAHIVSNEFILNAGTYHLLKGSLVASNLSILSGLFTNGGGVITNRGVFTLAGGSFVPGASNHQLGKLKVDGQARLDFRGGPAVIRFAASSGMPWYDYATLTIEHWNGSRAGGGPNRLICGSSQAGLTTQQLSKIVFRNPAGFAAGTYPARMLASGEVVPVDQQQQQPEDGPKLSQARVGQSFVFTWPAGYMLQTATNVAGPYEEVVGATSPFTNNFTAGPIRFYRLYKP